MERKRRPCVANWQVAIPGRQKGHAIPIAIEVPINLVAVRCTGIPPAPLFPCNLLSRVISLGSMDKLEEIFQMQDALNRRIGVNLPPGNDEEKAKWILNYTRALQQETAELIDSVPWKWWAKYQKFDEQNAKVEVVDLFHFLVSLAQTLGMTADDVYQAYLKKNAVNHARQESGYAEKDEADSKHI